MKHEIDEERVVELYARKWSMERIADELGCGPRRVRAALVRRGVELRTGGLGRGTAHHACVLDEAKVTELKALRRDKKLSWARLAWRVKASPSAVRKAVTGETWSHVSGGE